MPVFDTILQAIGRTPLVRLHKLVAFAIGGGLAGLAGCLFVSWGNYVSPTVFSVVQSATGEVALGCG